MDRDQVIDVLGRTSLFGGLHRDLLDSLASACVQRVYRRDQYLWYQGDPGDRLVVVASGARPPLRQSPRKANRAVRRQLSRYLIEHP